MATVNILKNSGGQMVGSFSNPANQTVLQTATTWVLIDPVIGTQEVWTGTGFTYDAFGLITGGIASSVEHFDGQGNLDATITTSWNFAINGYPATIDQLLTGADTINGGAGDDQLVGGAGADTINGGDGNDTISGGTGNNAINGGLGSDTVIYWGETGKVTVNLGAAATVSATIAAGVNAVLNPAHTDTLTGVENISSGSGADAITGSASDNVLSGGGGNDVISGGAGNDLILGGAGVNTLDGGLGVDTVSFADIALTPVMPVFNPVTMTWTTPAVVGATLNLAVGSVTVAGVAGGTAANFENVVGTTGNDTLTGNALDNVLDGGAGNDTMTGGNGNDTYVVDNIGDVVNETGTFATSASDTVRVETNYGTTFASPVSGWSIANYGLGANVENLTLAISTSAYYYNGGADLVGAGNALNNTITVDDSAFPTGGTTANVTLLGYAGNDTLIGGKGNDTLVGGTGADTMKGGVGSDLYVVDNIGDVVVETPNGNSYNYYVPNSDSVLSSISLAQLFNGVENARLMNVASALNVTGNASDNMITGNNNANILNGGLGNDTLMGGGGNDSLIGGAGHDQLNGGQGNDIMNGGAGSDTADYSWVTTALTLNLTLTTAQAAHAQAGADTLSGIENLNGGMGNDTLTGSAVSNWIDGSAGNDVINGLAGSDVLMGGLGADTFVFSNKEALASDAINDFTSGTDHIMLKQAGGLGVIGNGDAIINGAAVSGAGAAFLSTAELVIFTNQIADVTNTAEAALEIGSATTAFAVGAQRIFVVDSVLDTGVYLFTSAGADAVVSASELTLLGTTASNNALALGDYLFA